MTDPQSTCVESHNAPDTQQTPVAGYPVPGSGAAPGPTALPPTGQEAASLHGDGRANSGAGNRGGAPKGNSNAATHGLKGSKFPPGAIREQATVRAIVNAVKAACEAQHGHPLTVHQNAIIHRLRRAATKDRLAARWLRLESDKLTIEQRMALTDAMEASAATIEKCLKLLALDSTEAGNADPWAALDADRQPPPLPSAARSGTGAMAGVMPAGTSPNANAERGDC